MVVTLVRVWGRVPRPWGFEVRADFRDEVGALHHEELVFQAAPTPSDEAAAVELRRLAVEAALAPLPPDYRVICEDGSEVQL